MRESPLVGRERELAALVDALARLEDGLGRSWRSPVSPASARAGSSRRRASQAQGDVRFLGRQRVLVHERGSLLARPRPPARLARGRRRGPRGPRPPGAEGRAGGRARRTRRGRLSVPRLAARAHARRTDAERLSGLEPRLRAAADLRGRRDAARALAQEQPLCLVFEDLHWADESTLALVEELLELADREATVLVLLYRSERDHGAWHSARSPASASRTGSSSSSCARSPPRRASCSPAARREPSCRPRSPSCSPRVRAATRSSSRRRCATSSSAACSTPSTRTGSSPSPRTS